MTLAAVRVAPTANLATVAVPVLLTVLTVTQLVADPPPNNPTLVTLFALATVLPLGLRGRAPLAVTVAVAAALVGLVLAGAGAPGTFGSFLAVLVCVFTLARHPRPLPIVIGLAVVVTAVTVITVVQAAVEPIAAFEFVYPLVYFGGAGALGAVLRQRALRLDAVEGRAAALEGELAREAELAAAQERARIARELHDVVAHGISLMLLQAEAAEEMLTRRPAAAVAPLRRVQETGRQSLGEMRRLLGVLRAHDGEQRSTAPQPSLSGVDELVAEAAAGGLPARLCVDGDPVELPLGVQLAGYRIVQEALTNTRRHAGADNVVVRLGYEPGALRIEVADDGRGRAAHRTGHGLIGMRERVALYGGTLEAGPGPGGGFRVVALLPVAEVTV